MVKVCVLGTDVAREQVLFDRLREAADLVGAQVSRCEEPAECELLVTTDNSLMRRLAARLQARNPQIVFWVVTADGGLGDADHTRVLEAMDIAAELQRLRQAPYRPVVHGQERVPIAMQIRDCLDAAAGDWLLLAEGKPLFVFDFDGLNAVALQDEAAPAQVLGSVLGSDPGALTLRQREAGDPVPPTSVHRTALVPLLWQAALRMHVEPKPIAPLDDHSVISLARWPDFRVLAHRHDDFRLCSLLLRRPCRPREASHMLGIDPGAVCALFNAAYVSGYARLEAASSEPEPTAAAARGSGSRLAGMWRSLRNRMGA